MSSIIDMIFTGIGKAFEFLKKIDVLGVSLFSYLIAVFIIGLLITAVVNVVKQPNVTSYTTQLRQERAKNFYDMRKKFYERKNRGKG